jgi:hypothetical protein
MSLVGSDPEGLTLNVVGLLSPEIAEIWPISRGLAGSATNGLNRKLCFGQLPMSFQDLIGATAQRNWKREPKFFGRLKVDNQSNLG